MFQNLVALPHPVSLTAEGTCNMLPPQERRLLPGRAVPIEWVGGVLAKGAVRCREITGVDTSLYAVSLLKRLLDRIQGAVPFKRDFSMSSAKRNPVPKCLIARQSRLPSSEFVCWLPHSCPAAQPLGASAPAKACILRGLENVNAISCWGTPGA